LNNTENILDLKVDDINDDGLKDIIVAELSPSRLLTFMNLGDTNNDTIIEFGNSVVVGSYPQNYSGSIISVDFNSLGIPDFVIPTSDNFIFQHRYISNNNYRQEMIGYGLFFVRDIQVADVDNDSDLDLVFSHDRSLSWMENKGNDEFSNPKLIFRLPENDFPRFQLGFIDDDNLLDIVTSGNDEIRIYTNSTTADFELVQTITTNRIFSVLFEDFDLDGDLDIVSNEMIVGSPNQINLYSNNDGTFAFDQLIGVISIGNTFKIISGDVDGDGDVDVVTQRVGWFENTGNGNFNDLEILINNGVDDFLLYDLDGDSLLDVVGINNSSSDIAFWSRNLGDGDFTGFNVISSLDDLNGFTVGDFDGDNDGDIILSSNASSNSSNQIIVNLDSGFTTPSALPSIFGNASNRVFLVSDINNDNRDDIITGYQNNGRFSVFTNATTLSLQDDIFSQNSLVLYPNPISDDNSILRFSDQIGAVVTIYDLKGTMLFSEKLTNDTIDLSRLSVGIYILKLTNGSTEQAAKLIRM